MSIPLDNEWYSIKKTAEILRISSCAVHNRIKKHKSSATKIKECEYKIENHKYFIHIDYIHRCMGDTSNKEWFSINEACKILGTSDRWWRRRLENGDIPQSAYKKDCKLLIHISYINKQKQYIDYLEENYYTCEDACNKIDKPIGSIYALIRRGIFKEVISSKAGTYLSKKEIDKFIEMTKDTIKLRTIMEELNLSEFQALEFIKNEPLIIANNVNGQQYLVKIDSYQKFKDGLIYTVKMASEFLNTSYEITKMLIEKNHIESFIVNGLGLRTSKHYLEKYLKKGQIPIEQLAMEWNIKISTLLKYVYNGELKTKKENGQLYIQKDDAKRFKNSLSAIKMKYYNTDKAYDLFNDLIIFFRNQTVFKETVDLYEVWAKKELEKSRSKNLKEKVKVLLYPLEGLLNNINKEIFLFTDDELENLFDSLIRSHIETLYRFINKCKIKRKCNYFGDYVLKRKESKEGKAYTKEEWCNLTLDVLDIEKHFEKAVESKKQAEIWLWTLLQFSLDWRKEDLKEFKQIQLDVVGIDSFEWFDQNIFTLEISHTILKTVERSMKGARASKNKEELILVVPFIFEMPTALAFTLCELHRRKADRDEKKLITSSIKSKDLKAFFSEGLPEFLNRRCSKSLTTYGWETAVKKGKGALAYWLGGFARSHTHKIDIPNPVTQVYIVTNNTDASVEEMALHAFERGIFGWQVKVMIDALNNHKPLSLDEMTKEIAKVNKIYSPMMVDSLSKYAVTRHEQSVSLLNELMSVPKDTLKNKLKEISKLQSPSLLNHSQCIAGVKNCPYLKEVEHNLETPCLGCKNRIDTNYILDIVNVELFTLINRLNETPSTDKTSRIKYTHMIRTLSYILMDFKLAYDKYDPGYIRSFIDLDKLRSCFRKLEQTKFLQVKDEEYI